MNQAEFSGNSSNLFNLRLSEVLESEAKEKKCMLTSLICLEGDHSSFSLPATAHI